LSDENDAELAKLLELKRGYKSELAALEVQQRMQLAAELAEKKKELTEKYATQVAEKIAEKVAVSLKPLLTEVFLKDE
jgi:RNase P subunit RPR2